MYYPPAQQVYYAPPAAPPGYTVYYANGRPVYQCMDHGCPGCRSCCARYGYGHSGSDMAMGMMAGAAMGSMFMMPYAFGPWWC